MCNIKIPGSIFITRNTPQHQLYLSTPYYAASKQQMSPFYLMPPAFPSFILPFIAAVLYVSRIFRNWFQFCLITNGGKNKGRKWRRKEKWKEGGKEGTKEEKKERRGKERRREERRAKGRKEEGRQGGKNDKNANKIKKFQTELCP